MSINVSFINMKGGVGKTTLAMQVALGARAAGLKVLAVDLDPQSNLSQAVLGAKRYKQMLDQNEPTVAQIFEGYSPPTKAKPGPSVASIGEIIRKCVDGNGPDLIASRLELCQTLRNPGGKERRLAEALAKVSDQYEIVIMDCAPTDSMLTDAAYSASGHVVVPVRPEFLAAIGLPLLARSLKTFKQANQDHTIEVAGVVFVLPSYSPSRECRESIAEVSAWAKDQGWRILSDEIPYSAYYPRSAREGTPIGRMSGVRPKTTRAFNSFANELFGVLGIDKRIPDRLREYQ